MVHVADVFVSRLMLMILRDDLVKERSERVEAFMAARIDTNTRIGPLATREDALLEGVAIFVFLVLAFVPDVPREDLGEEGLSAAREIGEAFDLLGAFEVRSHHHAVNVNGS